LGLAHNQLQEITARVFSHLILLNSLELEGNQISYVHPDAFIGLEGKTIMHVI
jgi:Leucine-rich repeat (LRR) protein